MSGNFVKPDPMVNKGGKVPVSSNVEPVRPPRGGSRPSSHLHRTLAGKYVCITDTDCPFYSMEQALADACNGLAKGFQEQSRLPTVTPVSSFLCTVTDCENDGYPVREDRPDRMIRLEVADSIERGNLNRELAKQGQ